MGGFSSLSLNFLLIIPETNAKMIKPCKEMEILLIKASIDRINRKGRLISKINENHPLLVEIMPSSFKTFGNAPVMSERGISRYKYNIKNKITSPHELYCNPNIFKRMNSKKTKKSIIGSRIAPQANIVLILLILTTSFYIPTISSAIS
mgnify:CR=1 FL=1